MIVTPSNFDEVVYKLANEPVIALDTETTGLRPYHGDRPFSIIMNGYYFNLHPYDLDLSKPNVPFLFSGDEPEFVGEFGERIRKEIIERERIWVLCNAKFDIAMLEQAGFGRPAGTIHCVQVTERLLNDWDEGAFLSLGGISPRYGVKKDGTVEKYIMQHRLYTSVKIPARKTPLKLHHYDRVPFDLIVPYGLKDAECTLEIAKGQRAKIRAIDGMAEPSWPKLWSLYENERALLPIVYDMEKRGVLIDHEYCHAAIEQEQKAITDTAAEFKRVTGRPYVKSAKTFEQVFKDERWVYKKRKKKDGTFKETVCFDKDALETFKSPVAKIVLANSRAKANINYYQGFLYHADSDGVVHTSFNQHVARTGRFSSSAPNLQNMKKDRDGTEESYSVRRAIVPRPGHFFGMLDYDQVEYRMMADYAGAIGLIELVKSGLDVHQATADKAGITRSEAKNVNFGIVYGQGDESLGLKLHISTEEAKALKRRVLEASPEIELFIDTVKERAVRRGFIFNWMGRRYHYDRSTSYKAPNGLIQGGAADVIKCAMIACARFLEQGNYKTRLVLCIHDELVFEGPKDEVHVLPKLRDIMESVFPHKYLKLTAGIDVSYTSLADKQAYGEGA